MGDKEKQNEPLHKASGANEAKATLKTWLRGRAAGAGSRPENRGNVRKMLTAVQSTRRARWAAAKRRAAGPGPRWDRGQGPCHGRPPQAGGRAAEASWRGGPGGRASGTVREAGSAQSVTWRLGEGSLAGWGREEASLVSFHLKRVD